MRPTQQEAGKAPTSHANHHHVHLREPLKKLNRLRRHWFCGSQLDNNNNEPTTAKSGQRKCAQEPIEVACHPNEPSRLIRMIADKNAPKHGAGAHCQSEVGEMLILLGSAQCPRDEVSVSQTMSSSQALIEFADRQSVHKLSRRPSKSCLLASRSSTSDNSASATKQSINADRTEQLIGLLNEFSKQTELIRGVKQAPDSSNPAANKQLSRSLSSSSSSSFTSSQSARSRSKRQLNSTAKAADEEELLYLEDNWTDFVRQPTCQLDDSNQSTNLRVQQDAIWELLTSEVFYIKRLKVIIDLFLTTLLRLQSSHSLLIEVDAKQLFSNISEILDANRSLFWAAHLLPMLDRSRKTGRALNPALMRNAFVQMRAIFNPYYKYCLEHTSCLSYFKATLSSNECFKLFVSWCESQKDCERLRLTDLLAKPMQRLTRYSLLLKAILKRSEQRSDLELMILETNKFVLTVDLELRRKEELELLMNTKRRIDSYDIPTDVYSDEVERLLRSYCRFDLATPLFNCASKCHRQLLFDSHLQLGQVRFKDAQTSGKLDVVLLLFTDHLFVCKQTTGSGSKGSQVPQVAAQALHLSPRANSLINSGQVDHQLSQSEQTESIESARDFFSTRNRSISDKMSQEDPLRLRVIRAPYPIERLVVHELKDSQALFVCQLNDSQTIASSFVLYLEAKRTEESVEPQRNHLRSQNQSVESNELQTNQIDVSPGGSRRRSSDTRWRSAQTAPARQLAALIKQAQLRYSAAAAFHGLKLSLFEPSQLETTVETKRLSTWSSFRHQARAKSPTGGSLLKLEAKQATTSGSDEQRQWLSFGRRSASSDTNQLEPNANERQQQPQMKAVVEQQQSMLLNHGLHDQLLAFEFHAGAPVISKSTCSQTGSQNSVFEEPIKLIKAPQLLNSNKRRHNLGRSARVSTNFELSSDYDEHLQNYETSSSSSTRSSSPFVVANDWRTKQTEQKPVLNQRASGRKNLSSLRRQNVILSVSSEQQPVERQEEDRSVSVSPSESWIKQRQLARQVWSQATTADQTSAAFDEVELVFGQSPTNSDSTRATSFELGNLRNRNRNSSLQTVPASLSAQPTNARSASVETRSSVSVTLTLPSNENQPNARPAQLDQIRQRPESAVYLRIPSKQAKRHNFAASSAPMLLDLSAARVEPERSKSSDDSSNNSPSRWSQSSKNRPMFKLSLQTNNSSLSDEKSSIELDNLPMVEVINASPQALHSSCEFPVNEDCSSLEDQLSADQPLSCSADSHSAHFLKRCQTFLHFRRSPSKFSAEKRLEASKRSSECKSNGLHLRMALSDDAQTELEKADEPLLDMKCIGNLMQLKSSNSDTEEEEAKAKAYLGFHEKLQLHNQRLAEERIQSSNGGRLINEPAKSNRSAFKQFKHKTSPLYIKRTLLSKSPRHSSSTSSFSSGSRSFKALNLTRSMTGDIFDSFLRATSLRSVSPGKANL